MRIMPDIVHTFHIGIGVDFCSSTIVLLANKKKFVSPFGDKLNHFLDAAYTAFIQWCKREKRYTACDVWTQKAMGEARGLLSN